MLTVFPGRRSQTGTLGFYTTKPDYSGKGIQIAWFVETHPDCSKSLEHLYGESAPRVLGRYRVLSAIGPHLSSAIGSLRRKLVSHVLGRYRALSAIGPHLSSAIGSLRRKLVSPKKGGGALTGRFLPERVEVH